jgi:uncharacterized integral membrane protein
MRGLSNLIATICGGIIVAALVIFAVENARTERYTFLGVTFTGNVWWIVIGSALLGLLFAAFLFVPGRITAGLRSRTLSREHERTKQELAALRSEHEQLQAEHERVVNEREQQQPVATPTAASVEAPSATTGVGASTGANASARQQEVYSQRATSPTPASADDSANINTSAAPEEEQRSRYGRLREGEGAPPDETRTPNSSPAATA